MTQAASATLESYGAQPPTAAYVARSEDVVALGGRWGNEEIARVSAPPAANGKANGVANGVANGKANGVANDAYHLRSEELQKAAALDSRWGAEEVARINGAAAAAGAWAPQDASASLELLDAIDAKYASAPSAVGGHNHAYVVRNKDAHALSGRWGAEELHRIVKA